MAQLLEKPQEIAKDHFLLKIQTEEQSLPGQFINVKVSGDTDPLLRRPFSIYDHNDSTLSIVIKVIGKGTKLLSRHQPGDIDILGPLGKGFTIVEKKNVLLAGGGVGNAPLLYLARELKKKENRIHYIYGSKSKDYMYGADQFEETADSIIYTTDDGSFGRKGFVNDTAVELLKNEQIDLIYTCGPTPMMKGLVSIAGEIPIEVSLENYFGCGIGLCVGCTVETSEGFKRACIDGPVFSGQSLSWDNIA
jgi:dihydroorotate dehydrogenase electron transfer subunit